MLRVRHLAAVLLAAVLMIAGSAVAWAADSITIDFVRHGQAGDFLVINNDVPGPGLTPDGWGQAWQVARTLRESGIDQIFTSEMTRAHQTALPLSHLLHLPIADAFGGLDEIDAGIFTGLPLNVGGLPLGAVGYALAPFSWTLGLYLVPQLGSSDVNGVVFADRFGEAVADIYSASEPGDTVAVFSHQASIAMWALMNADNPDFLLMARLALTEGELLPYGGVVEMVGDPVDGWSLLSWAGNPVAPATLPVELFVDLRDLITAPQIAGYHLWEALLTGDLPTVFGSLETGVEQIGTALLNFPFAVGEDLTGALLNPASLLSDATILSGQAGDLLAAVFALL